MEGETKEATASVRSDEEAPQADATKKRTPPLLAGTIVRKANKADPPIGIKELCDRIYRGVLIEDNKQKFWVHENLDKNCFLVLAKELSIIWMENGNGQYWDWINEGEQCYSGKEVIPVAQLKSVCWLEISGTFKTIRLSPKTTYEVTFKVKMSENSSGWHTPVNLSLTLPDGTKQGRIENLGEKRMEEWIDILVGTFITTSKNVGEISFCLFEKGGHWKSGLLVKGVVLQPKD